MASLNLILASACLIVTFQEIYGHGFLAEPVGRNAAFKKGFNTPENWNLNELFCGGATFQNKQGGRCGVCGDRYTDMIPRAHENGGKYGTGTIVRKYNRGQRATIEVNLSANHLGHFEFAVCPLKGPNDVETEECFNKHPVKLANGGYKHEVTDRNQLKFNIDVILPHGLSCKHCSFRWHYRGGNNWGICEDGIGRLGCGPQEHFRNCADVTIF